jgi:K+-sensing histidine kinase KdpD
VLETAADLTRHLGGVLLAGYVRTGRHRQTHSPDGPILAENVALAETLGATIVTTEADDVAKGLIAMACREHVTHTVIGHAGDPGALFGNGSIVEVFAQACPGMEIQVVSVPAAR